MTEIQRLLVAESCEKHLVDATLNATRFDMETKNGEL